MGRAHRGWLIRRIPLAGAGLLAALAVHDAAATATDTHDAPTTITLPGARVFPESITSTRNGTVYIGSLGQGGILRAPEGARHATVFIEPGALDSHSIFGVLADESSGTLWACSNDLSNRGVQIGKTPGNPADGPGNTAGRDKAAANGSDNAAGPGSAANASDNTAAADKAANGSDRGGAASAVNSPQAGASSGSAVLAFDLKSGRGKLRVALAGDHPFCNDFAIGPDGALYVTNMLAGEILRLKHGAHEFEVFSADAQFRSEGTGSLDGLAFGGDGNLYVDTFTTGRLYRIAVHNGRAGKVTRLSLSRPLTNPDALRLIAGDSFALVEGAGRLDRVRVTGDHAAIDTIRDGYAGPTGVTLQAGTAWVSEGQLAFIFDPARRDQSPRLPFKAYAVDVIQ